MKYQLGDVTRFFLNFGTEVSRGYNKAKDINKSLNEILSGVPVLISRFSTSISALTGGQSEKKKEL